MDKTIQALLILNPNSRSGNNVDLDEGLQKLKNANFQVLYKESSSLHETEQIIEKHHADMDLIIMGGGDGTISSVMPCLYRYQLPLAVLPLGTANDFARSLSIATLSDAFQAIIDNQRSRINLGMVNDRYFINVAHMGLGVHVTHELDAEEKQRWGVLSYLIALIRAIRNRRRFRTRISIDGKLYKTRSMHLAIGNGRFYGGGNIIDDQSTLFDGKLSLYSLKPQSVWELLTLAPYLRNGMQRQSERVFSISACEISVLTAKTSEIHADGEPIGHTPALFKVIPDAINVIINNNP